MSASRNRLLRHRRWRLPASNHFLPGDLRCSELSGGAPAETLQSPLGPPIFRSEAMSTRLAPDGGLISFTI